MGTGPPRDWISKTRRGKISEGVRLVDAEEGAEGGGGRRRGTARKLGGRGEEKTEKEKEKEEREEDEEKEIN